MKETDKRKRVFRQLIDACHKDNTAYSVATMCTKISIDYAEIQAWAKEHEMWAHALDLCKSICKCNAEIAFLMNRHPLKEPISYVDNKL